MNTKMNTTLISILIFLIVSITPAFAIQNSNTDHNNHPNKLSTQISQLAKTNPKNNIEKLENNPPTNKCSKDLQDPRANAEYTSQQLKQKGIETQVIPVTDPSLLKKDDVIQYKSQGKYYRYLQVENVDSNYIYLKGSNNEIRQIHFQELCKPFFKLEVINGKNSEEVIDHIAQMQIIELEKNKEETQSQKMRIKSLYIAFMVLLIIAVLLLIVGGVIGGIGVIKEWLNRYAAGKGVIAASSMAAIQSSPLGILSVFLVGLGTAMFLFIKPIFTECSIELERLGGIQVELEMQIYDWGRYHHED